MYDTAAMDWLQGLHKTSNEEFSLLLGETPLSRNMIAQVTSQKEIHHEIEILSVLKGVMHVHNEPNTFVINYQNQGG
jgi:hypothetical protein